MRSLFAAVVLIVLCLDLVTAQCPDPVTLSQCAEDPCENQQCNRFYNADCTPNLCFGEQCAANFFWRGRNVTSSCSTSTCDARDPCPVNRQCMEEVVTVPCGRFDCERQYLRTRCVLITSPRTMTCADMTCGEQRACRIRDRGLFLPPVVRCLPYRSFGNCDQATCDEGLTCVELGRNSINCTTAPTTTPEVTDAPTTTPEVTNAPTTIPKVTDAPTTTPEVTDAQTTTPEVTDVDTTTPEVTDVDTTTPEVTDVDTTTPKLEVIGNPLSALCDGVICRPTSSCFVIPTDEVENFLDIISDQQQPESVDGPNSPVCIPINLATFFGDIILYP